MQPRHFWVSAICLAVFYVLSCTLPHFCLESILQGTVTKPNLGPFAQSTANQSTDSGLWWRKGQHLLQDSKQGVWTAHAQKTSLSLGFQGRAFKGKGRKRVVGCMISLCTFLWLVSGKVTGSTFKNLKHQPSGSNCSGIYALVVSEQLTSAWWGFSICKTTQEYGSG